MTKPARLRSKGRLACNGSSDLDRALMLAKPPSPSGLTAASEPPAIMASAWPYLIARKASPTAWVLVEHAETTGRQGPCALKRMAMLPAPTLEISIGMKWGEMRETPSSTITRVCLMKVDMPPIPEPAYTPKRAGSMFSPATRPLSATAWMAAQVANWLNRSVRRTAGISMPYETGLKSLTLPATCRGSSPNSSMPSSGTMPQRPSARLRLNVSISFPMGEMTPIPVITTLLASITEI